MTQVPAISVHPGPARRGRQPPLLARVAGIAALFLAFVAGAFAAPAEVIPPAPKNHFNDYARLVRPDTATQLNRELAQFERDTSNQIVVAIFPRMQSPSSVEDYTVRVAQAWRVGQAERRNGAVLFVFQESHDIRIVTGYGLEGALPDALAKQIVENEIIPRFRNGDFDGGLAAGVRAMIAATRGEYRGRGALAADARGRSSGLGAGGIIFLIVMLIIFSSFTRRRRGVVYGGRGRRVIGGPWGPWGGGGFGGGGWGGGGGGGGTFSGGGGSFGGGGAGGRW